MARLDDLIEEYRTDGRDDDAEELEKLRGSTLRQKASRTEALEKELADLKSENESLKRGPEARKAFEDYGIDLENLSKAEQKVLEAYDGDLTAEAISKVVEEYELPTTSEDAGGDEKPAAERVAQAARNSESGRGKKAPTLAPSEVSEWSMEKRVGFADAHPEAWEALKRGETVTRPSGQAAA